MSTCYRFFGVVFFVFVGRGLLWEVLGALRALNAAYTLELLEAASFLIQCQLMLDDVKAVVRSVCSKRNCLYALLFSRGYLAGENAGVGVAVMFEPCDDPIRDSIELSMELEEVLGFRVNVIPLNIADSVLRYEVFSYSVLAYCRDYMRYLRDKASSIDDYLMFKTSLRGTSACDVVE